MISSSATSSQIVDYLPQSAGVDGHCQPSFGSICMLCRDICSFSSLSCVKRGRRFLEKDLAREHETNAIVKPMISSSDSCSQILDCLSSLFVVAAGRSPLSMWLFLSPLFPEFIGFWAQTISFWFCLSIAIQYGAVELLTKRSGQRNRLRHKIAQTMTYCSSLNSCSIVKVGLRLGF